MFRPSKKPRPPLIITPKQLPNNILHFFTDNRYVSFLQYKSIYSFWLLNKDWEIRLYTSMYPTSKSITRHNYFNKTLELIGKLYQLNFKKLGFRNSALAENKAKFFETYAPKKFGGHWFKADKIFFDKGYPSDTAIPIDLTLNIKEPKQYPLDTLTGQALSMLDSTYITDMINYHCAVGPLLDVGCGDKAMEKKFVNIDITSIDAWNQYCPTLCWDLNKTPIPYDDNSFDYVIALDLIEHLDKDKGEALLTDLKRIARKKIILLTPLWWTENTENYKNPDSPYYANPYDLHRSLWTLDDFKDWTRFLDRGNISKYFFGMWEKK